MLTKTPVPINFAQGMNTKIDPKQLQIGKFQDLQNSVFTVEGLLKKRNGFPQLHDLPTTNSTYVTTLNDNLTAIGNTIQAYSAPTDSWVTKGNIQPMKVSVLPLVRNNINQTQCDSVIASNLRVCTVYSEVNSGTYDYKYVIADSTTGQNIVAPTLIPAGAGVVTGSPRVFLLGNYFVIAFTNLISSVYHLQYVSVNVTTLAVTSPVDIAAAYIPANTVAWDGVVSPKLDNLYIAYNTTSGSQSVVIKYLSEADVSTGGAPSHSATFTGEIATMFTLSSDETLSSPIIYVIYYDAAGKTTRTFSVASTLATNYAPMAWFTSGSLGLNNLASTAQSGVCTLVYEANNTYSYDSSIHTNIISKRTVSQAGSVSGFTTNVRSLGLASKGFLIGTTMYYLGVYSTNFTDFSAGTSVISSYQPTYFLINATTSTSANPQIVSKLAYSNAGGYLTTGVPNITVVGNAVKIPYLVKDLVQSVNKTTTTGVTPTSGVYAQTGINLASFDTSISRINTAEIADDLHISGGFLWMYDGYLPVEHNFFLYPDNVEATFVAGGTFTPTGTFASGSNQVVVSTASLLAPGMTITDTQSGHTGFIPAGTVILKIVGTTLTISNNTIGVGTSDTLSIQSHVSDGTYFYQVTYEWSDNQGNQFKSAPSIPISVTHAPTVTDGFVTVNVPTLRLTYKIDNPVKIVIYRWSANQQIYYQVTSVNYIIQNDTTVDSITFIDTQSDANILGNNILYTTGGVIEDISAPATNIMTLFDTRLWLVDAEDPNLLWFSKQIIEATPVEMSDLLTYFVAPNIGVQGSTGPVTALSAMDDKLIVFKQNAIYYINGAGPDNTGSNNQYSQPIFVSSSVGCSNQSSIVLSPRGIMFQSDKGIWLLGRDMNVEYIGAPEEKYNNNVVLSAISVPETTQIRFTLDNNVTLMYDYFYNQWGNFTGLSGISSCVFNSLHTYIDNSGHLYQESPNTYLDGVNPVLMSYTTSWISLAGLQGFERFYFMYLEGSYYSPFLLNAQIYYNYDLTTFDPYTITPDSTSTTFEARLFPSKQKCETFQLVVTEAYDPTIGPAAGQGLSLSGMNMVIGVKKGYRTQSSAKSFG